MIERSLSLLSLSGIIVGVRISDNDGFWRIPRDRKVA
jgi:hypothetical protein